MSDKDKIKRSDDLIKAALGNKKVLKEISKQLNNG